jgi:hypothetical protein
MRIGEVLALRTEDLDFQRMLIHIRHSVFAGTLGAGIFLVRSPLDRARYEACQFRNHQSRTVVKWRPWFYTGLVARSYFWLSERV